MRAHYSPDIPDGSLPARMNQSNIGGPFGVIELGRSEICCDDVDDARRLIAAAAQIVAWFEVPPAPHAFESTEGPSVPYGPCVHCGLIKGSNELHAEPAASVTP